MEYSKYIYNLQYLLLNQQMLIDFLIQDPDLFTIHKIYTAVRGPTKRTIRCIDIIPIIVNEVDGMKVSKSTVEPIVDEDGTIVRLVFQGKKIHFSGYFTYILLVPTFASILTNKKVVVDKNASSTLVSKNELCSGFHIVIDSVDLWIPCVFKTIKDIGTCSIIKDSELGRFSPFAFCCEGLRNKIVVNPKV